MSDIEKNSRNSGAATLGWALIGLGALFLIFRLFDVHLGNIFWPFFIIIPGLLFFVGMVMGGKSASPLAIPGSVITGTGLLLFYQNLMNHWESWAYAWTLYLGFVGVGIVIHSTWSKQKDTTETGYRLIGISLIMFLAFGALFELIFNISHNNLIGNIVWPGLFILAGLYLIMRRGKVLLKPSENGRNVEFEPIDMSRTSGRKKSDVESVEETVAE